MVGLPVRNPREGGGGGGPTPSEQDQQAHHSNDVRAHWFLRRRPDTNGAPKKPRQSAAGLSERRASWGAYRSSPRAFLSERPRSRNALGSGKPIA